MKKAIAWLIRISVSSLILMLLTYVLVIEPLKEMTVNEYFSLVGFLTLFLIFILFLLGIGYLLWEAIKWSNKVLAKDDSKEEGVSDRKFPKAEPLGTYHTPESL